MKEREITIEMRPKSAAGKLLEACGGVYAYLHFVHANEEAHPGDLLEIGKFLQAYDEWKDGAK